MKSSMNLFFFVLLNIWILKSQDFNGFPEKQNFYVYIQADRYGEEVNKLASRSSNFIFYKYLSNYYIDREKKGVINYSFVAEGLKKLYPNKFDSGFICLNLENEIYQNVKILQTHETKYKESLKKIIELIKYVKHERPNLKVGFYGLPFNFYYESQKQQFEQKNLDDLLREVDYISPHIYIYFTDKQKGRKANFEYIRSNLESALAYGLKFKKPVIPYVWCLIHPSNKRFGMQLIDKNEMENYINVFKNHQYLGISAHGIIWWEPEKPNYCLSNKMDNYLNIDDFFLEYTSFLQDNFLIKNK